MSYVFYDLETSGLIKPYDQIFQFGGIHTDENLELPGRNQTDEGVKPPHALNLKCNRLREITPSPQALFVTRTAPDDLRSQPRSHYEMMSEVAAWLQDKQPATFIGHNSIGFDENFLRYGFYKTLHNPYLTQSPGSFRADTMIMSHAVSIHDEQALIVPVANGKRTFRLGSLVRSNGIEFPEETAHDAFADVEATRKLAQLIRDKSPEIWKIMTAHADPNAVLDFLDNESYAYLSAVYFGRSSSFVVTKAAINPERSNEVALFDLRHDPSPYLGMDVEELKHVLTIREKPIRIIRANRYPILMPKFLTSNHVKDGLLDPDIYEKRANDVRSNTGFQARLSEALAQRYDPQEPALHVEEQIYTAMTSTFDQHLMKHFHMVPWRERPAILEQISGARIKTLGYRLLCTEAPEHATQAQRAMHDEWVRYRLTTADDVGWFTIENAFSELRDMVEPSDPDQADLFKKIREFVGVLAAESA